MNPQSLNLKALLQNREILVVEHAGLRNGHIKFVAQSGVMKAVLKKVKSVADTKTSVLLLGETGTGKELLAHMIHNLSSKKNSPMVKINCVTIPSTLIESELFGYEEGAFTGSSSKKIGRFESANGSTIFLDEIGELSPNIQSKLLRVVQEGRFERIGSSETVELDVRIIASTNVDITKAVKEGNFREDLYYRLNVFPIHVPPLRDRKEDIPPLVWTFIEEFEEKMGKTIQEIPSKTISALQMYSWPGNVRELRNVIERGMIISNGNTLNLELPNVGKVKNNNTPTLEIIERNYIIDVLETTSWRIRGKGGAAEILGLKPTTLESRMKKLRIKRKR